MKEKGEEEERKEERKKEKWRKRRKWRRRKRKRRRRLQNSKYNNIHCSLIFSQDLRRVMCSFWGPEPKDS